ncbi:Predicted alpha-1,6-mannanase, GH76 family [Raineyella antarctica]|uniref:Predicted alpha-1,6-mannanase, GH76 family n=1 Tax=Raineyella antarctica TaxID=1577474 RepID=A0A1G6GF85_9ACTN|nr:glycoside hydrolase family 76 protein [Raineyella antarctica]SDB80630.1 Predicted alpha-1,6-mannanase, GH76 family [Raineyella antarctica]
MEDWRAYAAEAERSVLGRHLRRPWFAPWARLARAAEPPDLAHRTFAAFYYWWQAHVLETLVDAQLRDRRRWRRQVIARWPAAMALRNRGRWLNPYYDDIAWLGLALDRAERDLGMHFRRPLARITAALDRAWDDGPLGGGIPWRVGDEFRNVPANGPMTILLARRGQLERAGAALAWLDARHLDPATGLVVDGIRPGAPGEPYRVDRAFHTYNQGLLLGAEVAVLTAALALGRAGAPEVEATAGRVYRLVGAVDRWMAVDHVVVGFEGRAEFGGDGGLFRGILARYLGRVVTDLPGEGPQAVAARRLAADLLAASAGATWRHRAVDARGVWFGPDPRVPARIPRAGDAIAPGASAAAVGAALLPERDLSVQVGGWMLLEAAARALCRS